MDIFRNEKLPKPWFSGNGPNDTDLTFFDNIHKLGYKVACDTRIKVGTYDEIDDIVW